jgi:hypothetical protein
VFVFALSSPDPPGSGETERVDLDVARASLYIVIEHILAVARRTNIRYITLYARDAFNLNVYRTAPSRRRTIEHTVLSRVIAMVT